MAEKLPARTKCYSYRCSECGRDVLLGIPRAGKYDCQFCGADMESFRLPGFSANTIPLAMRDRIMMSVWILGPEVTWRVIQKWYADPLEARLESRKCYFSVLCEMKLTLDYDIYYQIENRNRSLSGRPLLDPETGFPEGFSI